MDPVEHDSVDVYLRRIVKLADQVLARQEKTVLESSLATCIHYMHYYMTRNHYDDAPLFGPEADGYEENAFKVGRMKATAALAFIDKEGILPPLE